MKRGPSIIHFSRRQCQFSNFELRRLIIEAEGFNIFICLFIYFVNAAGIEVNCGVFEIFGYGWISWLGFLEVAAILVVGCSSVRFISNDIFNRL